MIMLKQIMDELDIHFKRINMIFPEIKSYIPFKNDNFEDIEKVKAMDGFVYRFTKIKNKMGDKIYRL